MSKQNEFVPSDASLMELAVVNWVLHKMKEKILTGQPSGQIIDQALEECQTAAEAWPKHRQATSFTAKSAPVQEP